MQVQHWDVINFAVPHSVTARLMKKSYISNVCTIKPKTSSVRLGISDVRLLDLVKTNWKSTVPDESMQGAPQSSEV